MRVRHRDASNFLSCLHVRQPFITAMRHPSSLLCRGNQTREFSGPQILPHVKGSSVELQPGSGIEQPLSRDYALAADYDVREGRKDNKKLYRCSLIRVVRRCCRANMADRLSSLSNFRDPSIRPLFADSYFQINLFFISFSPSLSFKEANT